MVSKLVTASYVLDVVVIVVFGLISYGFSKITPNYHPFSLIDLSISYPFKPDLITDTDLILASVVAPVVIILIIVLAFVPGLSAARTMSRGDMIRRKLWELFIGWLGLALSLITQFIIVQGLKNAIGKPRPDMLARCDPDLSNIAAHTVGGFGQPITDRWVLVDQTICRQIDMAIMYDGFRSFPSGHSGTSFAGLLYLTLFLCSKFNARFPYSPLGSPSSLLTASALTSPSTMSHGSSRSRLRKQYSPSTTYTSPNEAAASPAWVLFLIYVPVGAAIYISASRYFDYRHHGFDILSGALVGIICAWFAFRWYNPPLGHNAGYAWSPRSRSQAFVTGVGSRDSITLVSSSLPYPGINTSAVMPQSPNVPTMTMYPQTTSVWRGGRDSSAAPGEALLGEYQGRNTYASQGRRESSGGDVDLEAGRAVHERDASLDLPVVRAPGPMSRNGPPSSAAAGKRATRNPVV